MRGVGAMSAPRCAGPAMSRALLYPILDWPALCVASSELSSVNPGKSLSRDLLTNLSEDVGKLTLWKNCVIVHSGDVVDSTDAKTLAEKGKFCQRVLARLNTFVHCSNDSCFGHELIRNELPGSHNDSERAASSGHHRDRSQQTHLVNFPFRQGLRSSLRSR